MSNPTLVVRRRYRELVLREGFSLWRGLGRTLGTCAIAIMACLYMAEGLRPPDLWAVPFGLLYATFGEHLAHRWAMHHRVPLLERVFLEHRVHHRHFTHEAMYAEHAGDFQMVASSGVLFSYFMLVFVLPPSVLPWLLWGDTAAFLYIATGTVYLAAFEVLHLLAHLDPAHSLSRRFSTVRWVQRRHRIHHDPQYQQRLHFNVVWPLAGHVLGAASARTKRVGARGRVLL